MVDIVSAAKNKHYIVAWKYYILYASTFWKYAVVRQLCMYTKSVATSAKSYYCWLIVNYHMKLKSDLYIFIRTVYLEPNRFCITK